MGIHDIGSQGCCEGQVMQEGKGLSRGLAAWWGLEALILGGPGDAVILLAPTVTPVGGTQ